MTSKSASTRTDAIVGAATHGYLTTKGDPTRASELLLRVHALLADHAKRAGGGLCPSGTDVALAHLPDVETAIEVGFAVQAEVEAARPPGHRHGKLLGIGISAGEMIELAPGQLLGPPVARALRLAMLAGPAGDVLLDERAAITPFPDGLGRHEGKRGVRDLLGFGFHHLVDYR